MKRLLSIFTLLFLSSTLWAQSVSIPSEKISIKVTGTSTVHDWEVVAEKPLIDINFTDEAKSNISDVNVSVLVSNLVSGKSLMDSKMHDALGAKKTPNVIFKGSYSAQGENQAYVEGSLQIRGKEKPATIQLLIENGKVSGSYELNMTDFSVDPPTAMMGAISTGEVVVIHFEVDLSSYLTMN